jgi:hypothetical protein
MKAIFQLRLLPLALIVLFTQCDKINPNDPIEIPDQAFLAALLEPAEDGYGNEYIVDTNGDGEISYAEAEAITRLNVGDKGISDLSGIEAFINLEYLLCHNNQISELDISRNKALEVLYCWNNQLIALDVSNNAELSELECNHNHHLSKLDVSNNSELEFLVCGHCQLSSLNVSHNTALYRLGCFDNQLTSLDLSKNTTLVELYCMDNQLTSLDLTANSKLEELICFRNLLNSVNVSDMLALRALACGSNQLTTLDISRNYNLARLYLREMPSLTEVCVGTMPFPPSNVDVYTDGSPNVYFTTECSE